MKVVNAKHLTKRKRSQLSEKGLAATLGGKVQIASGALPVASMKGDVKTAKYIIDDKNTLAESYSLKLADFRKIRKQAFQANRKPAMRVNFEGRVALYIIEEADFIRLNQEIE